MSWIQPDAHGCLSRTRRFLRIGLSCCLSLLLLAPLQTVANFALANLALECEESHTEKAGSEHETQHLSHLLRRSWFSAWKVRLPHLTLTTQASGDLGKPLRLSGSSRCFVPGRPREGAGVRALC